ncbi:ATP-dependent DNA helicase RecG OS=Lysinibacillus sphaericus OX=1421 GN=recG PE=3 SV=1 [Lysinibacillus sphaericus]
MIIILETARKDATEMIDTDAFWHDEMYRYLREMLQQSGVLQGERFD